MRHAIAVSLCVLLLPCAALGDGGWLKSFKPRAIASYLTPGQGLLVAAAGKNAEQSGAAADTLREVIGALRSQRIVMDETAIGDCAALDDQAIAKRAAALPVDRIAVVRVFPGGAGQSAVVTFYDKAGQVDGAFSVTQGEPLAASGQGGAASRGEGVSQSAQGAVSRILKNSPENTLAGGKALREYNDSFIGFIDVHLFNQYGVPLGSTLHAYEGKSQRPLDGLAFYEKIGRDDLIDRYRSRRATKIGLIVSGAAVEVIGIVVLSAGLASNTPSVSCYSGEPNCVPREGSSGVGWGLGGWGLCMAAGMGLLIPGMVIKSDPLQPFERRRLANRYNHDLRKELGLPEPESDGDERSSLRPPSAPSLSLLPAVGPTSASMALRLSF